MSEFGDLECMLFIKTIAEENPLVNLEDTFKPARDNSNCYKCPEKHICSLDYVEKLYRHVEASRDIVQPLYATPIRHDVV